MYSFLYDIGNSHLISFWIVQLVAKRWYQHVIKERFQGEKFVKLVFMFLNDF